MYKTFVKGVNSKSKESWEEIYNYYYSALCNYSYKITSDKLASEDIVQSMLIKLWKRDIVFDNINGLTSYLYKSTYTQSLNFIRDNKKTISINSIFEHNALVTSESECIKMALDEEIISQFYRALEKMSPRQREVILLTMKGNKVEEIASFMDISINSVKTHKKRAYQFLRKNIDNSNVFLLLLFYYNL